MSHPARAFRERLLLVLAIVLALAPGTFVRTSPQQRIEQLTITPLAAPLLHRTPAGWPAGLSLEGLWQLTSADIYFGAYSALLLRPGGRAWAISDLGERLAFTLPGRGAPEPRLWSITPHPWFARPRQDIEAATQDPASGRYWLAYEQMQIIRRLPAVDPRRAFARPVPMRSWRGNSGAEAMVRLADGRFLLLGERNGVALLYDGDPVEAAPFEQFSVDYPSGYRPSDAAQLPDGRILILMRKVEFGWPPFHSLLLVGDVADLQAGTAWRPALFARLDGALPRENYEALAVERDGDASVLWLMSDDNFSAFQRSLLVKLRWRG